MNLCHTSRGWSAEFRERLVCRRYESRAAADGSGPASGKAYAVHGGDLAKYLYSRVIAEEKKTNPNVVATEAWGWLPPPLHHEGAKVQTEWLHDFLMDPTLIRPAVVLRMPNFHMSSDEASKLVDYFAAKSNAEFPYEYNNRRRRGYMAELEQGHPALLNDAMKIVTNGNYCVKCHSVGDYQVKGSPKGLGPNLDQVYRRLRPDYVQRWVGNPQRILPYTGMPVNIPFDPNAAELWWRGPGLVPWPKHLAIGWRGGFADELRRVHASADIGEGTREGTGGWRSAPGRSAARNAAAEQSVGEQINGIGGQLQTFDKATNAIYHNSCYRGTARPVGD